MEFSIKFETFKSGWSIIPRLYFPKNVVFLSLKIDFDLANYADPDEMSPSYGLFSGFWWNRMAREYFLGMLNFQTFSLYI